MALKLFPEYCDHDFELQPGEQKTHTLYLGVTEKGTGLEQEFAFVHCPLLPELDPDWWAKTKALPHLVPWHGDGRPDKVRSWSTAPQAEKSGTDWLGSWLSILWT
jgi:hypothetical protein